MSWIAAILLLFLLVRLAVATVNCLSRPYLPASAGPPQERISVLIPARNEERSLARLLADLTAAEGDLFEILVYDDQSDDGTAALVRRVAAAHPRIRLLRGGKLPAGWLGKNHACDALAAEARGDVLLFLDADVRLAPDAVRRAARCMREGGLDLLSLFPRQELPTPGSRLSVPLMNWILLSLLPLEAVRRAPQASLSAANGQFMAFRAARYRAARPHREHRASPVEDLAIAAGCKAAGWKTTVLLGRDDVACRMYDTLGDAITGFSKNIFRFFGGSAALAYAFALATTLGPVAAALAGGLRAGALYAAGAVLLRICTSRTSRQSVAGNLLLMIPQQVVLWILLVHASLRKRRRELRWKGRNVYDVG